MDKEIYVVPFFGNWAVKQAGKDNPVSTHNLKNEAIKIGQQLAKRMKSELIVIDEDINKLNDVNQELPMATYKEKTTGIGLSLYITFSLLFSLIYLISEIL